MSTGPGRPGRPGVPRPTAPERGLHCGARAATMPGIRAPAPEGGVRGAAHAQQPSRGKAYMPLYESVFIARQDIPAQEVEALAERFAGVIAEQGGGWGNS